MSKFKEYLKNNKTINEEIKDEDNLMDEAGDFLSKLNNNKEINLAIKNLNKLIKTKYNELLKSPKYKKNSKEIMGTIFELLSEQEKEENSIVDNAILNDFK